MDNYKLILPEHLNHYGFLYGGNLLKWADEFGYIAAKLDYPNCEFVTVGMDEVAFKKSVRNGEILRFKISRAEVGRTSVTYSVEVYRAGNTASSTELLFTTQITYVSVDASGDKKLLNGYRD